MARNFGRRIGIVLETFPKMVRLLFEVIAALILADFIGVGAEQMPYVTFGPVQVFGLVTGVILSLLGVIFYWPRKAKAPKSDEDGAEID